MIGLKKGGIQMRNKLILCVIIGIAFVVWGCGSTGSVKKDKKPRTVLLINCAAEAEYTDKDGRIWKKEPPRRFKKIIVLRWD